MIDGEHMTARLPDRKPTTRVLAMPADTNPGGSIFGGWLISQADIAGSIVAIRRAGGRVVTVAVNSFEFHQPVFVGDLISCYAEVSRVGRTSITVNVEVYAERELGREVVKVTEGELTFVAVDTERRPRVVPPASEG